VGGAAASGGNQLWAGFIPGHVTRPGSTARRNNKQTAVLVGQLSDKRRENKNDEFRT